MSQEQDTPFLPLSPKNAQMLMKLLQLNHGLSSMLLAYFGIIVVGVGLIALSLWLALSSDGYELSTLAVDSENRVWIDGGDRLIVTRADGSVVATIASPNAPRAPFSSVAAWKNGGVLVASLNDKRIYQLDRNGKIVGQLDMVFQGTVTLAYAAQHDRTFVMEKRTGKLRAFQGTRQIAERADYPGAYGVDIATDGLVWLADTEGERLVAHSLDLEVQDTLVLPTHLGMSKPVTLLSKGKAGWWLTLKSGSLSVGSLRTLDSQSHLTAHPASPWWSNPFGMASLRDGSLLAVDPRTTRILHYSASGERLDDFGGAELKAHFDRHRWRMLHSNKQIGLWLALGLIGTIFSATVYAIYTHLRLYRRVYAVPRHALFDTSLHSSHKRWRLTIYGVAALAIAFGLFGLPTYVLGSSDTQQQLCGVISVCGSYTLWMVLWPLVLGLWLQFDAVPHFLIAPLQLGKILPQPIAKTLLNLANVDHATLPQAIDAARGCYLVLIADKAIVLLCHEALLLAQVRQSDFSLLSLHRFHYADMQSIQTIRLPGADSLRHPCMAVRFSDQNGSYDLAFLHAPVQVFCADWLTGMKTDTRNSWLQQQAHRLRKQRLLAAGITAAIAMVGLLAFIVLGISPQSQPIAYLLAVSGIAHAWYGYRHAHTPLKPYPLASSHTSS